MLKYTKCCDSSVGIVPKPRDGRPGNRGSILYMGRDFFFLKVTRKTVWSSQPPIRLGPWALSPGGETKGREAVHLPR